MGTAGGRPAQGEPVIDRAFAILGAFQDTRRVLSVSEISRITAIPKATAWRLIGHLTRWGALEKTEDGRYVIGVRMWELASLAPRGHGIRDIALPHLEDLYAATGHHVILAIRDGAEAVMVDRLSSPQAPEVAYRVGGRMPLRSTAVGRVLLAHCTVAETTRILEQEPEAEPGGAPLDISGMRQVLAHVKQTGFSVVRRTLPSRTISVAAAIKDDAGKVVAALSVVMPEGSAAPQSLWPAVGTAARTISRSLGYSSPTAPGYVQELRSSPQN
ncbi:IclR family transcriptional regulator [Glutamicibacter sp. NPDC087344]|uniref:IclR family transcriptional regulator n=1 Tax=Glutamicibacter sp. NPDC087344 TaxID=3363994 RepID=UPI0037F427D7